MITLLVLLPFYIAGFFSALHALHHVPLSQERTGWVLALILLPPLALAPYWFLGRGRFHRYVEAIHDNAHRLAALQRRIERATAHLHVEPDWPAAPLMQKLASNFHFTRGNTLTLHPDGLDAFATLFHAIESARHTIFVQFFILRDDHLGRDLARRLIAASQRGVRVYVLHDAIGSLGRISSDYRRRLTDAGVHLRSFKTSRRPLSRFQLNFINHRKLLAVDGQLACLGGFNIGNEYLGRDPDYGPWRDTFVCVRGPAALQAAFSFIADWLWAADELLDLPTPDTFPDTGDDAIALALASGPSDPWSSTQLMFVGLIERALRRLWISTPYFIPDAAVSAALRCAALRGVDVRIVMPEKSDSRLVDLAAILHRNRFRDCPIRFLLYRGAFIHQKAVLVDDDIALVGSANTDARSIFVHFENSLLALDRDFAATLEAAFERDLRACIEVDGRELDRMSRAQRLRVEAAGLFSPVL